MLNKDLGLTSLYIIACLYLWTGCAPMSATTTYNNSMTTSQYESGPISLSFTHYRGSNPVYYFVLSADTHNESIDYQLKVRWKNHQKQKLLSSGMKSYLKFIINRDQIISLTPIKEPHISSYNINDNSTEEEITYSISEKELYKIAYAQNVTVEMYGKRKISKGQFNQWHTFQGFRKFLTHTKI